MTGNPPWRRQSKLREKGQCWSRGPGAWLLCCSYPHSSVLGDLLPGKGDVQESWLPAVQSDPASRFPHTSFYNNSFSFLYKHGNLKQFLQPLRTETKPLTKCKRTICLIYSLGVGLNSPFFKCSLLWTSSVAQEAKIKPPPTSFLGTQELNRWNITHSSEARWTFSAFIQHLLLLQLNTSPSSLSVEISKLYHISLTCI